MEVSFPKKFTSFDLKMIALVTMLIDHIGAVFFHEIVILRIIGRISFPLFAFLLAEGFFHTKDRKKYLYRVLIFALISEIPFDMAFYDSYFYLDHTNVLFTFFISLLFLYIIDEKKVFANECPLNFLHKTMWQVALIFAFAFLVVLRTDYSVEGLFMILAFYYLRDNLKWKLIIVSLINIAMGCLGWYYLGFSLLAISQMFAVLSIFFILMYNGEKGRSMKYLFYVFYPAHLLILGIIVMYFM